MNAKALAALQAFAELLEQPAPAAPADEVRSLAAFAEEGGLELKALVRAAKRAGIARRLGRQLVARRSALLALIDELPKEPAKRAPRADVASPNNEYALLLASPKPRGRRAA